MSLPLVEGARVYRRERRLAHPMFADVRDRPLYPLSAVAAAADAAAAVAVVGADHFLWAVSSQTN